MEQIEKNNKKTIKISKLRIIWRGILILIILLQLFLSMKYFSEIKDILNILNKYMVITFAIWISEYLILKGLTNKTKLSILIVLLLEIIFDIINYIVRNARGSSITISDIFALKTALTVSNSIKIQFNVQFFFGILFAIFAIVTLIIFKEIFVNKKTKLVYRILKIILGITIIIIFQNTQLYKNESLWNMNFSYRELGTPVTILRMLNDIKVNKPKGYDSEKVKNLLARYKNLNVKEEKDKPNIIVIVNESFSDYYNIYKDGYADSIEYFTKLSKEENVISGTTYSSELGGGTANVEYEFLTQNTYRILPQGSYAFQQYITAPVKGSIVENLKSQGYKTSAIHPWHNYAYSRNKIYKLFGFETIKFKDDIEGLEERVNGPYYTDESTYKELIRQIKSKKNDEKVFEYVLTVQNHVGYNKLDLTQMKYNNSPEINIYMQLLHKSAEALENLIEQLKREDEKYILLFFGDHQPNLNTLDYNALENQTDKYKVPFIIWANYDIEEKYNIETSTVFLQNYLLEAAGVKFSQMNNYMEELKKYYPVITKNFYIDAKGKVYWKDTEKTVNIKKLEEYDNVSYYRMFERKLTKKCININTPV